MKFEKGDNVIVWKNTEALKDKSSSWLECFERLLDNKPFEVQSVYNSCKEICIYFREDGQGYLDIPVSCAILVKPPTNKNAKSWNDFKLKWNRTEDNKLSVHIWCNSAIQRKLKKMVLVNEELTDEEYYTQGEELPNFKRYLIPSWIRQTFSREDLFVFSEDLVKTRNLKFVVGGFNAVDILKSRLKRLAEKLEGIEGRPNSYTIKVIEK